MIIRCIAPRNIKIRNAPISIYVSKLRRHATITTSVTSNDIPDKFFLLQFRRRVRYVDQQSLVIKAIQVRSLIVSDHVDQKEKRRKTQLLNDQLVNKSLDCADNRVIVLTDVKIRYKSIIREWLTT